MGALEASVIVAHFCWLRTHDADDAASSKLEQSTPLNLRHSLVAELGVPRAVTVSQFTVEYRLQRFIAEVHSSGLCPRSWHTSSSQSFQEVVTTGVLLLCEWSVIPIVGKDVKVGEAFGLAVEGLIERVNPVDGVIGLNVKNELQVVVALTDEGVEGDEETITLVLVELMSSSLSSS